MATQPVGAADQDGNDSLLRLSTLTVQHKQNTNLISELQMSSFDMYRARYNNTCLPERGAPASEAVRGLVLYAICIERFNSVLVM